MAGKKKASETPLMKQYNAIKAKHPDALLLFRVGDFYETFGEDAVRTSRILGIVLTKRANGSASHVELAGFPHHALETYLPKLVRAGERVAICDQLEDPKATKTIVKRGVTELVTPGVTYSDKVLDHRSNNFLAAVSLGKDKHGLALIDISTGEFLCAEGKREYIEKLLQGFDPKEVLYAKPQKKRYLEFFGERYYSYGLDDWIFGEDYTEKLLTEHFKVRNLKGFGLEAYAEGIVAAGKCGEIRGIHHHFWGRIFFCRNAMKRLRIAVFFSFMASRGSLQSRLFVFCFARFLFAVTA